jgi:hypothetical protein
MISFGEYLAEIAVNPDALGVVSEPKVQRSSSRIIPEEDKFNIIPLRIGYDTYNVFKRHASPRYALAERLLGRRGDSVDWVTLKASNQEVDNFKELAHQILNSSKDEGELRTASATLKRIEDSMDAYAK